MSARGTLFSVLMTVAFVAIVAGGLFAQIGGNSNPGNSTDDKSKEGADASPPPVGGMADLVKASESGDAKTTHEKSVAGSGVAGSGDSEVDARASSRQTLAASLTIFALAIFVGFEVITKVPPTLHTPLMSGSNAVSGITLVGALLVAGIGFRFSGILGFIAVVLATVNVVGGFLVTHRMLAMFKKR